MRDEQEAFMLSTRSEIARTVYHLCKSPHNTCYTAKVFQHITIPVSKSAVIDAVNLFENQGWIERRKQDGRIKHIELTEEGEWLFGHLVDFLEVLDRNETSTTTRC